jgi:hypothetical protein
MLITAYELKQNYKQFEKIDDGLIFRKLEVIESAIRKHTNNNFQNRNIRFIADVKDNVIQGTNPYLKVGDTIEISDGINKGLHVISTIAETIETGEELYDSEKNLITKIEYPLEVIEGAIDILDWELVQKGKEKSGIASETISRHSVTYVQRTGDNTINGYPIELFNFCKEYMKARF